jgi:hypothetical protein
MGNRRVLQIDATQTGEAMKERNSRRIAVHLQYLGDLYSGKTGQSPNGSALFHAINLCGKCDEPPPLWVYEACTKISADIPNASSWEDVLGSIQKEDYEAHRQAALVGDCVMEGLKHGVPLKDLYELISIASDSRLGVRLIKKAWVLFVATSGEKTPDKKAPPLRVRDPRDLGVVDKKEKERKDREDIAVKAIKKIL